MNGTIWQLAHGRRLRLGETAVLMGILNVTPDSFSDGGRYVDVERAVDRARRMVAEGAAIVDVGGESTRPGAAPVDADEERRRVLPVIQALAAWGGALISIDTYKASTARLAVAAGAHIVNDVWGLQHDPDMAAAVADTKAGVVVMHNGRDRPRLADPVDDQIGFLRRSLEIAAKAGVDPDRIVLDPGLGFAKEHDDNLQLMARFEELAGLGRPWLVGASRKRFVGHFTGRDDEAGRDLATAATSLILRLRGAAVFRVHDVETNRVMLAMGDAVLAREHGEQPRATL